VIRARSLLQKAGFVKYTVRDNMYYVYFALYQRYIALDIYIQI